MARKKDRRTYSLPHDVTEWLDKFKEQHGVDKSFVVERSVKYYAANVINGDGNDPKMKDKIDRDFEEGEL
jgi:hypothetical protein